VAARVGRSVEECILRFIELPIEEPYRIDALPAAAASALRAGGAGGAAGGAGSSAGAETAPRACADPMLAQLSLLAAAARPADPAALRAAALAVGGTDAAAQALEAAAASMRGAAVEMLAAVQARAQAAVLEEEAAMRALLASAAGVQMQRVELRLAQLDELSAVVRLQRGQLDRERQILFGERLTLEARRQGMAQAASRGQPPKLPANIVPTVSSALPNAAPGGQSSYTL